MTSSLSLVSCATSTGKSKSHNFLNRRMEDLSHAQVSNKMGRRRLRREKKECLGSNFGAFGVLPKDVFVYLLCNHVSPHSITVLERTCRSICSFDRMNLVWKHKYLEMKKQLNESEAEEENSATFGPSNAKEDSEEEEDEIESALVEFEAELLKKNEEDIDWKAKVKQLYLRCRVCHTNIPTVFVTEEVSACLCYHNLVIH